MKDRAAHLQEIARQLSALAVEPGLATLPPGTKLEDAYGEQAIIDAFARLYYDKHQCFHRLSFLGTTMQKYPTDLLVYADIMWRCLPDVIVETGTNNGTSSYFLGAMFDLIAAARLNAHDGQILTVDVTDMKPRLHPRVKAAVLGSSTDQAVLHSLASHQAGLREGRAALKTMVILDSDHAEAHVFEELRLYAPLVTLGQYLIVEDTNVNGNPVNKAHGPGPHEAVERFLQTEQGSRFRRDPECERFLLTANPGGFLKRVRENTE